MKRLTYSGLSAFILAFLFIISLSHSQEPLPYLVEESSQEFYTNGSQKAPLTAYGRLDIEIPNTQDVLQYIRINISNEYIGRTDIQSPQSFADVAASPGPADRTSMYFDTTDGYAIRYNITDQSLLPKISLELSYRNSEGGKDIHSGAPNTILFNMTISSDTSINNVVLYFKIRENAYVQDSMVIATPSATSSTALQSIDTDSDGYKDTVYWQGNLQEDTPIHITFNGTTQADINYNRNDQFVELNEQDSVKSTYSTTNTFTGITIINRFSRGPIRLGVRMIFKSDVQLSGTITNKAQGLTYKLTNWALYNVTNATYPIASGVVPAPQELLPQQTYDTPWHSVPLSSEKYFIPEFKWYVKWAPSQYSGTATSTLDLPTLYQADGIAQKSISLLQTQPSRILNIEDSASHLGHPSIYFNSTSLTSTVPSGYSIQNVEVYYSNLSAGGSEYGITSKAAINITGSTLRITIPDITKAIGRQLAINEDIIARYRATGPSTSTPYTFTTANTYILNTTSGTPLELTSSSSQDLPGTQEAQPSPGSAGGGVVQRFAAIEKSSAKIIAKEPQDTAEITAAFKIIDTGDKGVGSMHARIMLPSGSVLDTESVNISIYDSHKDRWEVYTPALIKIKKDPAVINSTIRYSLRLKSNSWDDEEKELNLKNGDLYSITYAARLPYGSNEITTRLYGFDYYTDKEIYKDIETYIKTTQISGYISPLQIRDSEFQPQQIIVGTPPHWLKTIDVYNPNSVSVQHKFTIGLFPQVISSHITSAGKEIEHNLENREIINAVFKDTIAPKEKKTYLLDITTPPIIITGEKYSIEKYSGTEMIFITNLTLENPSDIDYEKIILIYPVSVDNIESAQENGQELEYLDNSDGRTKILIPSMRRKSNTTITLYYLKTLPVLIVNTDKPYYSAGEKVNISIIFIPPENMSSSFIQIEVQEKGEDAQTIYADLLKLQGIKKSTPNSIYREFTLPDAKAGQYWVNATATLSPVGQITGSTSFRLESSRTILAKISFRIVLLAAMAVILALIMRIYRKKEFEKELSSLKKEVEKI